MYDANKTQRGDDSDAMMDGGRNPEASNHPFLLRRDLVRRIAKKCQERDNCGTCISNFSLRVASGDFL